MSTSAGPKRSYRIEHGWQHVIVITLNVTLVVALGWIASGMSERFTFLPSFIHFSDRARAAADAWMAFISLVLIVVLSFAPSHTRPLDKTSKYFTAWLAIVICAVCGGAMIWTGQIIPDVISGISLLGLTAGLLRALPFTEAPSDGPPSLLDIVVTLSVTGVIVLILYYVALG